MVIQSTGRDLRRQIVLELSKLRGSSLVADPFDGSASGFSADLIGDTQGFNRFTLFTNLDVCASGKADGGGGC